MGKDMMDSRNRRKKHDIKSARQVNYDLWLTERERDIAEKDNDDVMGILTISEYLQLKKKVGWVGLI